MRPCPKRVGCKSIKKIPFLPNLSTQTREKTAHQLLALLPEHPPRHGRSGVEHRLGITPEALLGIVGAPHHAAHLRPSDRPGAHDARLDRDVERALLQILAPERRGSGRQGLHLGVGRGVGQGFDEVVPPPDHRTAGHDDRTDGHLLLF